MRTAHTTVSGIEERHTPFGLSSASAAASSSQRLGTQHRFVSEFIGEFVLGPLILLLPLAFPLCCTWAGVIATPQIFSRQNSSNLPPSFITLARGSKSLSRGRSTKFLMDWGTNRK